MLSRITHRHTHHGDDDGDDDDGDDDGADDDGDIDDGGAVVPGVPGFQLNADILMGS